MVLYADPSSTVLLHGRQSTALRCAACRSRAMRHTLCSVHAVACMTHCTLRGNPASCSTHCRTRSPSTTHRIRARTVSHDPSQRKVCGWPRRAAPPNSCPPAQPHRPLSLLSAVFAHPGRSLRQVRTSFRGAWTPPPLKLPSAPARPVWQPIVSAIPRQSPTRDRISPLLAAAATLLQPAACRRRPKHALRQPQPAPAPAVPRLLKAAERGGARPGCPVRARLHRLQPPPPWRPTLSRGFSAPPACLIGAPRFRQNLNHTPLHEHAGRGSPVSAGLALRRRYVGTAWLPTASPLDGGWGGNV